MHSVRVLLVANPHARGVNRDRISASIERWSREHQVDLLLTSRHGLDEDVRAALAGTQAVAVLGGDGTLNRVANVMANAKSDATLVPLPGGTTNVVARTLGLPRALGEAHDVALRALGAGWTSRRGWGRLNGWGFLANAGVGFDAAVVKRVESRPSLKAHLGHLWFAAAACREAWPRPGPTALFSEPAQSESIEPGLDRSQSAFWVLALATHPYSYAGRRPLTVLPTGCRSGDGLWAVEVRPSSVLTIARLAGRMLYSSKGIATANGVQCRKVTSEVTYYSMAPASAQTDGEPMGPTCSFSFRWEPDALRLIAPTRP